MGYKRAYKIVFCVFILSIISYLFFRYRPLNIMGPLEETTFFPTIIGGLFSVAALFIYMGDKSGYIRRMSDENEVHLLLGKDAKKPLRKSMLCLEIGWLIVAYYEFSSLVYLFTKCYGSYPFWVVTSEITYRFYLIILISFVFILGFLSYKLYQINMVYWKIYLVDLCHFENDQERITALGKEVQIPKFKERVKKIFEILAFDPKEVKAYLAKEYQGELQEILEDRNKKLALEAERSKNVEKLAKINSGIDWSEYNG